LDSLREGRRSGRGGRGKGDCSILNAPRSSVVGLVQILGWGARTLNRGRRGSIQRTDAEGRFTVGGEVGVVVKTGAEKRRNRCP